MLLKPGVKSGLALTLELRRATRMVQYEYDGGAQRKSGGYIIGCGILAHEPDTELITESNDPTRTAGHCARSAAKPVQELAFMPCRGVHDRCRLAKIADSGRPIGLRRGAIEPEPGFCPRQTARDRCCVARPTYRTHDHSTTLL